MSEKKCPSGTKHTVFDADAQFSCAVKTFREAFIGCCCDGAERLALHLGMVPEIFKAGEISVKVHRPWVVICSCGYEVEDHTYTLAQAEEIARYHLENRHGITKPNPENTGVVHRQDLASELDTEQEGSGDPYLDGIMHRREIGR